MQVRGVLFDMDGLLLDSERLVVAAFQQTVEDFDLPDLSGVALKMIGLRFDVGKKILRTALEDHMDLNIFSERWHNHIYDAFDKGIPLKPGVTELLGLISARGLPCAVATSTQTDNAKRYLEKAGIIHYFQTITGGNLVQTPKPAPDIYLHAASSIGLDAQQCAAFEDSDPGTTAAIASGAKTVQVPDINPPAPDMHKLGHVIAPSLLDGARHIGLISTG